MTAKDKKTKLIFVYNADGGAFNLLSDIAHKIFSPATYACNLCAITHSHFGVKKEWREFLKTLDAPLEFLCADKFKAKYRIEKIELPAIFKMGSSDLIPLVDAQTINACRSIDDLKKHIEL